MTDIIESNPTPELSGSSLVNAMNGVGAVNHQTDLSASAAKTANVTAADVEEALRDVVDPELGINIVDLGLVYGVVITTDNCAIIDMTLTSAGCPLTDLIESQAQMAVEGLVNEVRINWVWLPPWGPANITPEGREQLRAIGFNV